VKGALLPPRLVDAFAFSSQTDMTNPYFVMSAGASAGGQVTSDKSNAGQALLYGPYHPLYRSDDPNAPTGATDVSKEKK
jgi:hypothetical protein